MKYLWHFNSYFILVENKLKIGEKYCSYVTSTKYAHVIVQASESILNTSFLLIHKYKVTNLTIAVPNQAALSLIL